MPAAAAPARIIEIGRTAQPNAAELPGQPVPGGLPHHGLPGQGRHSARAHEAPADGQIVAWTITLGAPGPSQIRFFNKNHGGASQAGITVLKPGTKLFGRVTGQSPSRTSSRTSARRSSSRSAARSTSQGLPVALTVPSWAPALALGMGNDTSWRASRARDDCQETGIQSAQLDLGDLAQYRCLYRTARLTYTATLITTPKPPKH